MFRHAMLVFPLLVLVARHAPAGDAIADALKEPTEVEFVDTPLSEALTFCGRLHRVPIEFDEAALRKAGLKTDRPVTFAVAGITLGSALSLMLEQHGMAYRVEDKRLVIVPEPPEDPERARKPAAAPETPGVKRIRAALKQETALQFQKTDLRDALEFCADLHGIPIFLDQRGLKARKIDSATVTYRSLPLATLEESLKDLLDPLGLETVIRHEVLFVTPKPVKPAKRTTKPGE